ncbi:hypothetical protein ACHAXM_007776 [Skeletonema potamos]
MMAAFLERAGCKLITLIMSELFIASAKEEINAGTLGLEAELSVRACGCRHVAEQLPLLSFDLSGNKSLKTVEKRKIRRGRYQEGRWTYDEMPHVDGGRAKIVKGALFDTTNLYL